MYRNASWVNGQILMQSPVTKIIHVHNSVQVCQRWELYLMFSHPEQDWHYPALSPKNFSVGTLNKDVTVSTFAWKTSKWPPQALETTFDPTDIYVHNELA